MNRILLIPVLLTALISKGQIDYRPIPETEATWIQAEFLYSAYSGHEHATITSVVYTEGDTMINNYSYRKFGTHGLADWLDGFGTQNQNSGTDTIPYSTGYFRQDNVSKKVFLWNSSTQSDELLYDFGSLIVGQPYPPTVTNIGYPNLLVMAVDSVQLQDGNYYKRWVLGTNSSDSAYVSVIEGVGGTNGFNTPIYPVFEQSSNLLCHKNNSQAIYENWITTFLSPRYSEDCSATLSVDQPAETMLELYPNPTNGRVSVQTDKVINCFEVYSINGQLLIHNTSLPKDTNGYIDLSDLECGMYLIKLQLSNDSVLIRQVQLLK